MIKPFKYLKYFNTLLLLQAEASALLDAVDEEVEPWSYADLPTREERAMPTYLIRDTRMVRNTLDTTMRNNPLTVPIVIGELWGWE